MRLETKAVRAGHGLDASSGAVATPITLSTTFEREPEGPAKKRFPRLDRIALPYRGRTLSIPYLYRPGSGGPAVLFIHGLGGAKENFQAALQSPALADCSLLAFDNPGTGLSDFDSEVSPDVSSLADVAHVVSEKLMPGPHFIAAASMGGLIALLRLRRYGSVRVQGFINLEGNLSSEDCMFSRRTSSHDANHFREVVFNQIISELLDSPHAGDRMIAHNMALNTDANAYHSYSFETVKESNSGRLMEEFLALNIPRLFLYGEANRSLTYLDRLRSSRVEVVEIPRGAHFLFYDNPAATFGAIGRFVHRHSAPSPIDFEGAPCS